MDRHRENVLEILLAVAVVIIIAGAILMSNVSNEIDGLTSEVETLGNEIANIEKDIFSVGCDLGSTMSCQALKEELEFKKLYDSL